MGGRTPRLHPRTRPIFVRPVVSGAILSGEAHSAFSISAKGQGHLIRNGRALVPLRVHAIARGYTLRQLRDIERDEAEIEELLLLDLL
jgi:hypothetical protein